MPPSIARSLQPSLARSLVSALGGARLPWDAEGGGGPPAALLALGAATFARASRASIVDAASFEAVASGVLRQRATGALILEGARSLASPVTSGMQRNLATAAGWAHGTCTYTAGVADGPDGSSGTADRFQVAGDQFGAYTSTASPAGWSHLVVWMRALTTGSGQTLVGYVGPTWTGTRVALGSTWQRVVAVNTGSDSGGLWSVADARVFGGGTNAAIDAVLDQVTAGRESYATSDLLDGARLADVLTWPAEEVPLQLREGRSLFRVHPCWGSANQGGLLSGQARTLISFGGSSDRLVIEKDGGGVKVRVYEGGVSVCESAALTISGDQTSTASPIEIVADAAAGTLRVNGATTTGTAWAWPGGVVARLGGVYGGADELDGAIYLPERV